MNNIPKYLQASNLVPKIIDNLRKLVNLEDQEVSKYACELFEGVFNQCTVRKYLDHTTRKMYGLGTCPICHKGKLKSLARHLSRTHGMSKQQKTQLIESIIQNRIGKK